MLYMLEIGLRCIFRVGLPVCSEYGRLIYGWPSYITFLHCPGSVGNYNFAVLLLRLWASLDLICQKNITEVLACHFQAWDSKGLVHFHLVSCTIIEFPFGTLPHPWEQAWESLLENERPCGGELWCPTANQSSEAEPTRQNTPELPFMEPKCLIHEKWVK